METTQKQIDKLTKKQNAAIARVVRNMRNSHHKKIYNDGGKMCVTDSYQAIRINMQSKNEPTSMFSFMFSRCGAEYENKGFGKRFAHVNLSCENVDAIKAHKFSNSIRIKQGKTIKIHFDGQHVLFDAALLKNVFEVIGYPSIFFETWQEENHCEFFLQTNEKFPAAYVRSDIGDALIMPLNPRYL